MARFLVKVGLVGTRIVLMLPEKGDKGDKSWYQ